MVGRTGKQARTYHPLEKHILVQGTVLQLSPSQDTGDASSTGGHWEKDTFSD